jgi:hypothetical protein
LRRATEIETETHTDTHRHTPTMEHLLRRAKLSGVGVRVEGLDTPTMGLGFRV